MNQAERLAAMRRKLESERAHVCGNCIYWGWSAFGNEPHKAPCCWPHQINHPAEKKVPEIKFPSGVEIEHQARWRDDGRNCDAFVPLRRTH